MSMRLRRLFILLFGLSLVLQFPGERVQAVPLQATSVSIAMSNPSCVQVRPPSGACSIQVGSLTVSGSDPTFSRLEVLVNGKLRVYMGGFFESSAYLTYPMVPGGLVVACGRPNASGLPNYGRAYSLTANAYMVDGTSASDSMTVFCPAYDGITYLPLIRK
jgi:hypothetical protein